MSEGIRVSQPNQSVTEPKKLAFTTEAEFLNLDVRHTPPMFDYKTYTFGTAPVKPGVGSVSYTDMLVIDHEQKYVPTPLVYFYNYNFTGSYFVPGVYQKGKTFLNGAGSIFQTLEYSVDERQLRIFYKIDNQNVDPNAPLPYDVTGAKFGFKYYLFANDLLNSDT